MRGERERTVRLEQLPVGPAGGFALGWAGLLARGVLELGLPKRSPGHRGPRPLDALEPGSNAQTPGAAVAGRALRESKFEYPPGEEPRPAEGEPTGWSHGELL